MKIAEKKEIETFLAQNPDTTMLEVLLPDINGILRCKRIPAIEFQSFFKSGSKGPASTVLVNCRGEYPDELDIGNAGGDPDKLIRPISGTLAPISWLKSDTAQILASFQELDQSPGMFDCRNVLIKTLECLEEMGLKAVVATELEFYLIKQGADGSPQPLLSKVPGTNKDQQGIQYSMPEELWDHDEFLEDVRRTCELQNIPMTTVHSEFSPGQYEINLHHVDDPVTACDHGILLKRIIKGVARKHGMAASFMAKPFAEIAGCGLHIHFSLYDKEGVNIFADESAKQQPGISERMRHAVGGLAHTMEDAMAIFAPTANAYRRLIPGNYAPLSPNWGYNHRDVSLRIPVSGNKDRRIEHRVASADANPYLVMAAIVAGIHYGLTHQCDPGPMIPEGYEIEEEQITLPCEWSQALDKFEASSIMPAYLGEKYCKFFTEVRRGECNEFHRQVPDLDYQWYLRAV